jgi:hypothetical protein
MLWKWTALMGFAHFPIINSVPSNAAELRPLSQIVVVVPMENRSPMTWRDVASDIPNSNEDCEPLQYGTPRKPTDRGPAVARFKDGSPSDLQPLGVTVV